MTRRTRESTARKSPKQLSPWVSSGAIIDVPRGAPPMSETFEAQLKRTLGSIVERLQSNLTEHVTSAVEEINTAAATESALRRCRRCCSSAEKDVTSRLEAEFATRAISPKLRHALSFSGWNGREAQAGSAGQTR